jgi:hypothetical protein
LKEKEMQAQPDLATTLVEQFADVADRLEAYLDRIAWETYLPSEQRTAGQLVDHIAWAWEAESAAFRAIAGGASGSGWTQEWLDAQNAEQARISATRGRAEIVARYHAAREIAAAFIRGLNETELERMGTHMPGEPCRSVAGWIQTCLIGHPLEHLPEIASAIMPVNVPGTK